MSTDTATILFLDTGPWFGGAQRSLLTLLHALDWQRWHPLVVAADTSSAGLLHDCALHEVPSHSVPFRHWGRHPGGVAAFLRDVHRLRRLCSRGLRRQRIDLVHANTVRAGFLAKASLPRSLPLVVHDRDAGRTPPAVRRMVARRADRIIAVSDTAASFWENTAASVVTIPNAFDVHSLQSVPPTTRLVTPPGDLTVLLVADFVPWKRHGLFLEAVRAASAENAGIRGVVVGRALTRAGRKYARELWRWVVTHGLQQQVEFVLDCENAVPWMAAADVVVTASEGEPFGRSVVESLAVGTPVIATAEAGPAEILKQAGAAGTVVPADAGALADAMVAWRCPVQRMAVVSDALRAARRYDIGRVMPRLLEVYEAVLAEKPAGGRSRSIP